MSMSMSLSLPALQNKEANVRERLPEIRGAQEVISRKVKNEGERESRSELLQNPCVMCMSCAMYFLLSWYIHLGSLSTWRYLATMH